ncbi:hypothetical protein RB195_006282 [Necator americanus]|uniref:Uncharacterized protein n=1 Tax=Necator americanus TaxID=51031 RepID=A0ABR1BRV2_NECAM
MPPISEHIHSNLVTQRLQPASIHGQQHIEVSYCERRIQQHRRRKRNRNSINSTSSTFRLVIIRSRGHGTEYLMWSYAGVEVAFGCALSYCSAAEMEIAQAMLYLPCDPEVIIFRVDSFLEMDWADALSLSMELDSFVNLKENTWALLRLTLLLSTEYGTLQNAHLLL